MFTISKSSRSFLSRLPIIRKKLDSLGLLAIGDHVSFIRFSAETGAVIDEHREIGCKFITIGSPGESGFPGGADYSRTIDSLNRIGEAVQKAGMRLLYHNHAGELKPSKNGKSILEHLMDDTDPGLLYLEPDLGWIKIGGGEPEFYLEKYRNRCPVVHFKDFIFSDASKEKYVFRPTGYGQMNNAVLLKKVLSFEKLPEWYVVDHDCAYEGDIFFELKISLDFFINLTKLYLHY